MYPCLCCNKAITVRFYFCRDCAIEFGLSDKNGKMKKPTEMPDWARELYNDEIRRRRRLRKLLKYESDEKNIDEYFNDD